MTLAESCDATVRRSPGVNRRLIGTRTRSAGACRGAASRHSLPASLQAPTNALAPRATTHHHAVKRKLPLISVQKETTWLLTTTAAAWTIVNRRSYFNVIKYHIARQTAGNNNLENSGYTGMTHVDMIRKKMHDVCNRDSFN